MDQVFAPETDGASPTGATAQGDDPEILSLVRQGDSEAFEVLYQRHFRVAQHVARAQTDNPSDADDVVAESFAAIFQLLMEGKGPKEFFRSYLLTVVRRTAHDRNRKARRMPAADDAALDSAVLDTDPVLDHLESSIMAKAFKSLPERWQAVLWHLDIEGLKPAAAAPLVGLTPNGVSSLAIRAREGLRQAYLQQHISRSVGTSCDEYAGQLGKYARNALKRASREKVSAHLDGCATCTGLLTELNDVQGGMRAILFPLVTGIAFTPGVLAAAGSGTTGVVAGSAAGSTAVSGHPGSAALRSAGQLWKVTAAIVVAALATVGVLVWFLQPNTGSAVVTEAPVNTSPAPEGTSPGETPGAAGSSAPAVPDPTVAPTNGASAAPEPSAVVIPAAPMPRKGAVVIDSDFVFATTAPLASASAVPLTQTVDATFASNPGPAPDERALKVQFSLQGQGEPTAGEAIFSLPRQATFAADRIVAPAGWKCAQADAGMKQVRCTTDALAASDLTFTVGVTLPAAEDAEALNYRFGGSGIVTKTFANSFH
ncbi:sigma-70 family RNA polymerase sigma factor [Paenarthrobacter nitroguajacolicus]|uniref:sigma-70 family RNA polymerase sigma factor n=1 Tax=Paenarthrobacter nitroguajacolicus TaxID=211146 RepID=UPI004053836E